MQNNILYDRFTTLPNIRGHFHRPRIDGLLSGLLDRHLIIVTAGAGWGKTHAVSAFLHNTKARVIWFQLSELDNHPMRFWEEFIHIMEFQNKETSVRLEQLGFPETLAKYDKFLHILALEIYTREQVIFVFDDFHLIYDKQVVSFLRNLILAKLENLCVIINSRLKLSFSVKEMISGDLVGRITGKDLYFTREETEGYLKHNGVSLTPGEIEKVHTFTEGWPLALYLVGLSIKKGGMVSKDPIAGAVPLIFEMIETELFSGYEPEIQNFMIRLSLLNSFPEDLVKSLAEDCADVIAEYANGNMFIYYNPYTRNYHLHHLFLEFLNGKHRYLNREEITETYLKAAEWCAANDQKLESLSYYDKCGRYDKILNIMFNFGVAIFSKTDADFYISLIDKFPEELMKKNPLIHVHHAGLLCNNAEVQSAVKELLETLDELNAAPSTQETKNALGEVYCFLGLINLGTANYDFTDQFKKAGEYLPHGSFIMNNTGMAVNTRYAIMLSRPEPGELKRMENAMFEAMPYASKTMNGYGEGLEYLASAEAAYFTGDMKKAAKNAYEAVYRAREGRVADVASSGYFLLMRVEAANGSYNGVAANLEQMKAYVGGLDDKWNFNGMPDVAEGWFNLMMGSTEKTARWLVDDTLGSNVLAPYSMGMERSIKAKYLLKEGKYYELLAWISQSEKSIRQYGIWLILIDILIYKAIAFHHIYDETQAADALREAYEIANGNNLVMQFAELGNDIRAVIYKAKHSKQSGIPNEWLNEIYAKAATYEKRIRSMKVQYKQHNQKSAAALHPSPKITKREKEILGYLCQGLTNTEIAESCFITISAVKKTLNNIYIKLGSTNRVDAVRTAIQLELHK